MVAKTNRPEVQQRRPADARRAYTGSLVTVWTWEQPLGDGRAGQFEQVERPDTVLVLPIRDDGTVILGLEKQPGDRAPRLHALGGRLEGNEDPIEAARRELLEEAGLEAEVFSLWAAWQPLSKLDWVVYIYWASGLRQSGSPRLDPGEDISLKSVPLRDLTSGGLASDLQDNELLYQLGLAALSPPHRARLEQSLQMALGEVEA